jgi:hypothetical protein
MPKTNSNLKDFLKNKEKQTDKVAFLEHLLKKMKEHIEKK